MEVYGTLKQIAKEMKMNVRSPKATIQKKCEEVWLTSRLGNRKLVGYCKPRLKSYIVPQSDYDAYNEWKQSQGKI